MEKKSNPEKTNGNSNGNGKNTDFTRKPLGPVNDLEAHVHPEWWKKIFNALYLKTDSDVIEDNLITRHEVDLIINNLNPNTEEKILDLCCGQGRHVIELTRRGFKNVEGIDRSHYLINRARSRAKKDGWNIKFKEGDARKIPCQNDNFDVVMILGNSFGYFETVEDDLRVLKEVLRILKPSGKILIDVADGAFLKKHFQSRSWEWINAKEFVCRERSISHDGQKIISREVINHADKGIIADQFYAERLYSRESLTKLLSRAGFQNINFPDEIITDSKRNQDLGMMERRIIATASIKKEWTIRKRRKEDLKNVVVVMGDPSKLDIIKPDAVFDEDDFYTINQLKAALIDLKQYNFSFLNNHNSLMVDLKGIKGKADFILNLCDEGYNNDPQKELHIPALLEMVGIPYTGSNPQCLAMCYDKSLVRGIAKEMGIPVPEAYFIKPEDSVFESSFPFPVIVKPNFGDSSFGITQKSVANTLEQLLDAITSMREKFGYDKPILVEEFLVGKDLSVGIIGNPPSSYTVLPISEEDYSEIPEDLPRICGYEAKWDPNSPYWNIKSIEANLDDDTEKLIVECCIKLFKRLDCRDYARFDWRLDANNRPKLLEVNPNPGWCWDGHLAKMAKFAGISYSSMLESILSAASHRINLANITEDKKEEKKSEKCVSESIPESFINVSGNGNGN